MEKLILRNELAPGDVVMMTAAVRDLHVAHPGRFLTDVRTPCPALWANNPYITPIRDNEKGVRHISCEYPLIHRSNSAPYHFIHGFTRHLAEMLKVNIEPTLFKGDIHLSSQERNWSSQVQDITGGTHPFWLIAAGGKQDFTIKWWDTARWQEVVDHFRGRILFVQVGEKGHHHPPLHGVLDLRGKTSLRQLVRLVHHAQGVVCPVTAHMHLAAAVETRPEGYTRPCVVVAGGREPPHWETYPGHRFIHTMGALNCCSAGGCWRSRTKPLNDGDPKDLPQNLCMDVVGDLPRCMDIIAPEHVAAQIESYFHSNGPWRYLNHSEAERLASFTGWARRELKFRRSRTNQHDTRWPSSTNGEAPLTASNVVTRLEQTVAKLSATPTWQCHGKGVVICGGGLSYLPSAWVNAGMLRRHGCTLPIELWHLPGEVDDGIVQLFEQLGVTCVDCHKQAIARGGQAVSTGWEMKPLAILYSSFEEVLFMDADNMAVADPTVLFEAQEYRQTEAVFWPDYTSLAEDDPIWKICGIPYRDESEFESGQILINKVRHWRPLQLALWFNRQASFFRHYFLGDKETFHFAFRYLEVPYAMPPFAIENLENKTMCQHDFSGRRIFQHRNLAKWSLHGRNDPIAGFAFERECMALLAELRRNWKGRVGGIPRWEKTRERTKLMLAFSEALQSRCWYLHNEGEETTRVKFGADGRLHSFPCSQRFLYWDLKRAVNRPHLEVSSEKGPIAELEKDVQGNWTGFSTVEGQRKRIQISREHKATPSNSFDPAFRTLIGFKWAFRIENRHQRTMTLNPDGTVGAGAGHLEMFWHLERTDNTPAMLRFWNWERATTSLSWNAKGWWEGGWTDGSENAVTLRRLSAPKSDAPGWRFWGDHGFIRFARQSDCESPSFIDWCSRIREHPRYHRRQWELVTILGTVKEQLRKKALRRAVVVHPADDALVDALANMSLEVVCLIEENWFHLPPSRRQNRLQSFKRELNRRGITPWQNFERLVQVLDAENDSASSKLDDDDDTIIILQNPFKSRIPKSTAGSSIACDLILSSSVSLIATDVLLEPSEQGSGSGENRPPTMADLEQYLRKPERAPQLLLHDEAGLSTTDCLGPVDTYVDSSPYQGNHHLKLRTPHGIVTSACLLLTREIHTETLASSNLTMSGDYPRIDRRGELNSSGEIQSGKVTT